MRYQDLLSHFYSETVYQELGKGFFRKTAIPSLYVEAKQQV